MPSWGLPQSINENLTVAAAEQHLWAVQHNQGLLCPPGGPVVPHVHGHGAVETAGAAPVWGQEQQQQRSPGHVLRSLHVNDIRRQHCLRAGRDTGLVVMEVKAISLILTLSVTLWSG